MLCSYAMYNKLESINHYSVKIPNAITVSGVSRAGTISVLSVKRASPLRVCRCMSLTFQALK